MRLTHLKFVLLLQPFKEIMHRLLFQHKANLQMHHTGLYSNKSLFENLERESLCGNIIWILLKNVTDSRLERELNILKEKTKVEFSSQEIKIK